MLMLRGPGSQIGATFRNLDAGLRGAAVVAVQEKSPAAIAGILPGDRVAEFDGLSVQDSRDLNRLVSETPPGRTVSISVVRNGRMMVLKLTPRS